MHGRGVLADTQRLREPAEQCTPRDIPEASSVRPGRGRVQEHRLGMSDPHPRVPPVQGFCAPVGIAEVGATGRGDDEIGALEHRVDLRVRSAAHWDGAPPGASHRDTEYSATPGSARSGGTAGRNTVSWGMSIDRSRWRVCIDTTNRVGPKRSTSAPSIPRSAASSPRFSPCWLITSTSSGRGSRGVIRGARRCVGEPLRCAPGVPGAARGHDVAHPTEHRGHDQQHAAVDRGRQQSRGDAPAHRPDRGRDGGLAKAQGSRRERHRADQRATGPTTR